jgi:predicted HicB family RNase H-like nuclease
MIEKQLEAPVAERYREVLQTATSLFERSPDWVTFFREVLGINGVVRRAFPDGEALATFERSDEYSEIQQMLVKLRESSPPPVNNGEEPTRVITVRLPKSVHEAIRTEALERRVSMNKLCISKLLQVIDEQMVPAELP